MQQIESPSESLVTQTDPDLLSQFLKSKDELAFTELIRRHSGLVMRICRLFLKETYDQEDAFQATFLVLAKSANRIRKRSSLSSWLHGVAYRTARRAAQDMRKRQAIVQNQTLEILEAPQVDLSPFEKLQSEYEEQILHDEVQQLSQKYREPILRRYFEGQSVSEIATELKVSVGVIEGRLKRAKLELGSRLIRRGIDATGFLVVATALASTSTASAAVSTALTSKTATLATQSLSSSATTLASTTIANLASKEIAMITTAKIGTMLACLLLPAAALLTPSFLPVDSGQNVSFPISTQLAFAGESSDDEGEESGFVARKKKKSSEGYNPFEKGNSSNKKKNSSDPFATDEGNARGRMKTKSKDTYGNQYDKNSPNRTSSSQSGDYLARSPERIKIEKALSESISFDFNYVPIYDVVRVLSDETGIPIIIDGKSLEGLGFEDDHLKFYLELKNTTLQNGLDLILPAHDLDYIIKNDVLMIVSGDDAESFHETRIYDVNKIVADSRGLPELIERTANPNSWYSQGGEGTVFAMQGAIIVRNNQRTHASVVDLLEQLKKHNEKNSRTSDFGAMGGEGEYGTKTFFSGFERSESSKNLESDNNFDMGMGGGGGAFQPKTPQKRFFPLVGEVYESEIEEVEDDENYLDKKLDFLTEALQTTLKKYEILEQKGKKQAYSELESNRVKMYLNRIEDLEGEIFDIKKSMAFKKFMSDSKDEEEEDEMEEGEE